MIYEFKKIGHGIIIKINDNLEVSIDIEVFKEHFQEILCLEEQNYAGVKADFILHKETGKLEK